MLGSLVVLGWSCSLPRSGIDGLTPTKDADGDGASALSDCDEANAAVNPDAEERCNGIDDNCDGVVDDDAVDRALVYTDADSDGVGAGEPVLTCVSPSDVIIGGDCDDADFDVHPGACEHPADGIDTDCDGTGDSEIPVTYSFDACYGDELPFQTAEPGPVAVRVVGSQGDALDYSLERTVHITASKPMVLVLASDDPTHWTVDETTPGTVQRVIVTSTSEESTVNGIDAPVDSSWGEDRLFDYDDGLGAIDDALFGETGIHLTSRGDCWAFHEMTLSDGDAWPSESAEYPSLQCPDDTPFTQPRTDLLPEDCRALIVPGTPVCLTTMSSWVFLTQPDGDLCKFQIPPLSTAKVRGGSTAWRGDALYACAENDQLVGVRFSDLQIQRSYASCTAVTDWNDGIVIQGRWPDAYTTLEAFETWGDVNSGRPIESYPDAPVRFGEVLAIEGDTLYAAVVGSAVWRFVLGAASSSLDPITLEGFDGLITGLDVTEDGDILVLDRDGYLRSFDSEGHAKSAELIFEGVGGLFCFTP